jgi:hypothetical protein
MEVNEMKRFLAGLAIGLFIGASGVAVAATITGPNGFLNGWTVTRGKEVVCQSPFVHANMQQIDCD